MNADTANKLISIVVPVFNEKKVIEVFFNTLTKTLNEINYEFEMIFVDDGSQDQTLEILRHLKDSDQRVAIVELSRNFGKEIALTAGLDHSKGDAVIVMDADLQDPPDLIPQLIDAWQDGFEVVYATRVSRKGESWARRFTAHQFYRVIGKISHVEIPQNTGDFRLLGREAVDALVKFREQHRFMKGLFSWIGYAQTAVPFQRQSRYAGESKWNYWKLWNFALEGITSFTTAPLRIATYLGLLTASGAFIYGAFVIVETLISGNPVAGYPSLLVIILFLGGVQLIGIGIIGEYLGRVFDETKQRPLYLVKSYKPALRSTNDSIADTDGGNDESR